MSHEITNIDKQQGIAQAWHGLTEIVSNLTLANSWLAKWDVMKRPLWRILSDGTKEQTDTCEIVCTDDERITVGKPVDCESYGLITNADFLAIVGEAIAGIDGAKVASIGSVGERNKVFVSVELKELPAFTAAGRKFLPYLNFGHAFDMQAPFWANTSNTCTVCANTFAANLRALKGAPVSVRIKHTRNAVKRIQNVPEIVDGFLGAQAEFKSILDSLNSAPMARYDARPFFAGLLANGEKEEMSTRRANQTDRLVSLFIGGRGNAGQTRADAFQAVTEYATHESSGARGAMAQILSSEFGSGAKLKERALTVLQDDATVRQLVTVGEANLATLHD